MGDGRTGCSVLTILVPILNRALRVGALDGLCVTSVVENSGALTPPHSLDCQTISPGEVRLRTRLCISLWV